MEYMQWCIDMRMEPVLAVWAGLSLDANVVPGESAAPYIQDILNELEFLLGDASTPYGSLRAKYGRIEPYTLRYIEIGNEDNLSGGCSTYASRFTSIYSYVHHLYPSLILIASTGQATCLPESFPAGAYMDIHHYLTPDQFVGLFNEFDHTPRHSNFGVIVGEYASLQNNGGTVKQWQDMQGSCGEAVYMIGLERNSDVVKMASYAPLLEHYGMAQWSVSDRDIPDAADCVKY
jgi:alpha-N-arabinofuranosidase